MSVANGSTLVAWSNLAGAISVQVSGSAVATGSAGTGIVKYTNSTGSSVSANIIAYYNSSVGQGTGSFQIRYMMFT